MNQGIEALRSVNRNLKLGRNRHFLNTSKNHQKRGTKNQKVQSLQNAWKAEQFERKRKKSKQTDGKLIIVATLLALIAYYFLFKIIS